MKIEKNVKQSILDVIARTKRGRTAIIEGRKEINAVKKIGKELGMTINNDSYYIRENADEADIYIYNRTGEWNGYGYQRLPQECKFPKVKIKNYLLKKSEIKKPKKIRTYDDTVNSWCRRLSKLTGITEDEAKKIAKEKEEYHQDRINDMIMRDNDRPSVRRGKLISKMERENPLRHIKNSEHAQAILAASDRHNNTDYDYQLEEAKEKAELGEIDRSEVREYARQHMS